MGYLDPELARLKFHVFPAQAEWKHSGLRAYAWEHPLTGSVAALFPEQMTESEVRTYVVVGPTGVFVLESKNWAVGTTGTWDPVTQVRTATDLLRHSIHHEAGVWVPMLPVLVISHARPGVLCLPAERLREMILREPRAVVTGSVVGYLAAWSVQSGVTGFGNPPRNQTQIISAKESSRPKRAWDCCSK